MMIRDLKFWKIFGKYFGSVIVIGAVFSIIVGILQFIGSIYGSSGVLLSLLGLLGFGLIVLFSAMTYYDTVAEEEREINRKESNRKLNEDLKPLRDMINARKK